ncbi:hypothetical protein G6F32_016224 [Rhizopus arrhizus]|nr:hypothetical protein G6F32_016224 [Rhizopus arrhizus]
MKLPSSVVTTSSTPSRVFSKAGISSSKAPARAAASIMPPNSTGLGRSQPVPSCRPPMATAASAPRSRGPAAPML